MTIARPTNRFFIDLLDIDSLPRTVRPAFLEWAVALDDFSTAAGSDDDFDVRVRLEAARRHAIHVCQASEVEAIPKVRDLMVYLSFGPEAPLPAAGEKVLDLPAARSDDRPSPPPQAGPRP